MWSLGFRVSALLRVLGFKGPFRATSLKGGKCRISAFGFQELGLRRSVVGDLGLVFQFLRFGFNQFRV